MCLHAFCFFLLLVAAAFAHDCVHVCVCVCVYAASTPPLYSAVCILGAR